MRQFLNVVYDNTHNLKVDIFANTGPLVVSFHGGGWISGNEDRLPGKAALLKAGFSLASVQYRLSTVAQWPAQILDCRNAITFLGDPDNIQRFGLRSKPRATIGRSAGAHLAVMCGLFQDVECVVGIATPTDLPALFRGADAKVKRVLNKLFGGTFNPEVAEDASPIANVDSFSPPMLLVHGTEDRTVPINQAQRFVEVMHRAGRRAMLHTVTGGGHTGSLGGPTMKIITEFLKLNLRES